MHIWYCTFTSERFFHITDGKAFRDLRWFFPIPFVIIWLNDFWCWHSRSESTTKDSISRVLFSRLTVWISKPPGFESPIRYQEVWYVYIKWLFYFLFYYNMSFYYHSIIFYHIISYHIILYYIILYYKNLFYYIIIHIWDPADSNNKTSGSCGATCGGGQRFRTREAALELMIFLFLFPWKNEQPKQLLGGGNSNIFWNFHPEIWGRFPIWRAYFSNGLKAPTSLKIGARNPKRKRKEKSIPTSNYIHFQGKTANLAVSFWGG